MQSECACNNKHCRCLDVEEGQVATELGLDDRADAGEVRTKMVYHTDGSAGGDGGADLAEVLFGFAKQLLGVSVICGVFTFLGQGLRIWDEEK